MYGTPGRGGACHEADPCRGEIAVFCGVPSIEGTGGGEGTVVEGDGTERGECRSGAPVSASLRVSSSYPFIFSSAVLRYLHPPHDRTRCWWGGGCPRNGKAPYNIQSCPGLRGAFLLCIHSCPRLRSAFLVCWCPTQFNRQLKKSPIRCSHPKCSPRKSPPSRKVECSVENIASKSKNRSKKMQPPSQEKGIRHKSRCPASWRKGFVNSCVCFVEFVPNV